MALPVHSAMPFISSKNGIPSLSLLLQDVTPAVVNISVQARSAIEDNPLFRDPFFRRFFDTPDQADRPERSAGSGVIVDAGKGYVVTNFHVIKDARTDPCDTEGPAAVSGEAGGDGYPGTDIALLKIEAKNLQALRSAIPICLT